MLSREHSEQNPGEKLNSEPQPKQWHEKKYDAELIFNTQTKRYRLLLSGGRVFRAVAASRQLKCRLGWCCRNTLLVVRSPYVVEKT